jgi:hypothetical protein
MFIRGSLLCQGRILNRGENDTNRENTGYVWTTIVIDYVGLSEKLVRI